MKAFLSDSTAQDFIQKPFSVQTLSQKLKEVLKDYGDRRNSNCKSFILFFSLCLFLLFSRFLGLFFIVFFSISCFCHMIYLRKIYAKKLIALLPVYHMYLKMQYQSCIIARGTSPWSPLILNASAVQMKMRLDA